MEDLEWAYKNESQMNANSSVFTPSQVATYTPSANNAAKKSGGNVLALQASAVSGKSDSYANEDFEMIDDDEESFGGYSGMHAAKSGGANKQASSQATTKIVEKKAEEEDDEDDPYKMNFDDDDNADYDLDDF